MDDYFLILIFRVLFFIYVYSNWLKVLCYEFCVCVLDGKENRRVN